MNSTNKKTQTSPFDTALAWIFPAEGGYVDDIADPGGATQFGISLRLLKSLQQDINQDGQLNELDVQALNHDDASAIYHEEFWLPCRCDELPPLIAITLFDAAANTGLKAAVKALQRACYVTVDGIIGPQTIGVANRYPPEVLLTRVLSERACYYRRITAKNPVFKRFIKGWFNRLFKLQSYLMETFNECKNP